MTPARKEHAVGAACNYAETVSKSLPMRGGDGSVAESYGQACSSRNSSSSDRARIRLPAIAGGRLRFQQRPLGFRSPGVARAVFKSRSTWVAPMFSITSLLESRFANHLSILSSGRKSSLVNCYAAAAVFATKAAASGALCSVPSNRDRYCPGPPRPPVLFCRACFWSVVGLPCLLFSSS